MREEVKKNRQYYLILFFSFCIGLGFGAIYLRDYIGKSPNDGYLFPGDRASHTAGGNYFQQQPWSFPVYDIEGFRYPEGGSLIYTDGIPFVATFVKLLFPLHGHLFDYFGWYVLLCYGLQSLCFALILYQCSISNWRFIHLGALFIVATPTLLFRVGHAALCSHYLILLVFLYYLKSQDLQNYMRWALPFLAILCVSLLIHPYLFLMGCFVYMASFIQVWINRAVTLKQAFLFNSAALAGILLLMFITGYIRWDVQVGIDDVRGFGIYSMNLLSPVWPQKSGLLWWNTPILNPNGGQYEGYAWLGWGVISLVAGAFAFSLTRILVILRRHFVLSLTLVLLSLISLSSVVYAGNLKVLQIPLDDSVMSVLNTFRVSGRFFWPVIYAVACSAFVITIKHHKFRTGLLVIAIATTLQVLDCRIFLQDSPAPLQRSEHDKLKQAALQDLISFHERVALLPVWYLASEENYKTLGDLYVLSSLQNIPISSVNSGRPFNWRSPEEERELYLGDGFHGETLYLFLEPRFGIEDAWSIDPTLENTRILDDLIIVSSNVDRWESNHRYLEDYVKFPELTRYPIGTWLPVSDPYAQKFFANLEPGGNWTLGKSMTASFYLNEVHRDLMLLFRADAHVTPEYPKQRVKIYSGDTFLKEEDFNYGESFPKEVRVRIPMECVSSRGILPLKMEFPDAVSPKDLGLSDDPRMLGLYLREFAILKADTHSQTSFGEVIGFSKYGTGTRFLKSGFSEPETEGIWTVGEASQISIPHPVSESDGVVEVTLRATAFLTENHPRVRFRIRQGDRVLVQDLVSWGSPDVLIHFAAHCEEGKVTFEIEVDEPASPSELGISQDTRRLGLYVRDIVLERQDPTGGQHN